MNLRQRGERFFGPAWPYVQTGLWLLATLTVILLVWWVR